MTPAPAIHVSRHAIERYLERIGAASEDEARRAMQCAAVAVAGAFGARIVRLTRGRLILRLTDTGIDVITVVPLDHLPPQLIPVSFGGPPPVSQAPISADRSSPTTGENHGETPSV